MMWILYRSLKLRGKLAFILITAIIILSVIIGLYFDYFLRNNFAETTQERIDYTFHRFNLDLQKTENELKEGVSFIKDDEALLASVELINAYQDKINYNAVLLDEEKKSLAEELLIRVKLSLNNDIVLYDSHQELVTFVMKTSKGYYLTYISFEEGKPIFYSRYENELEYKRYPFKPNILIPYIHVATYSQKELLQNNGVITYHRFGNDLIIKSHQSLFDKDGKNEIAHIEMSHYISKPYFLSLSKDLGIEVSSHSMRPNAISISNVKKSVIYEKNDHFIGVSSIKTLNGTVYIIAALDKSILQKLLNENRITFISLILFITLLTVWILKMLFDRGVAQPLQSLMYQIEKIELQDYSDSAIIHTGDELEAISHSVKRLASTINERESALIATQKQLKYLSDTDPLTDLPNRRLLYTLLRDGIELAQQTNYSLGVIFLDLDQFKQVNDTLGHEIGDVLLQQVARRLQQTIRDSDTLARIGGDEFNILIEQFKDQAEIEPIIANILMSFNAPFLCQDHEIHITASIGIALYPQDGDNIQTLIKNADMAMYLSKDRGRNRYSFFTQNLADRIEEKNIMIGALKAAMDKKDEFFLVYQPKVSAKTGKIVAVEALLRWNSSELGRMINPDQFIPIAEETGIIIELGAWVLYQACSDFMHLRNEGNLLEHIGINVSSLQLQSDDFMDTLKDVLRKTQIDPKWLEIELTESYLATDADHALSILRTLRDLNINIAIDDFGTGYSSMSYLQKLAVTRLKIDKSFIDDLPVSSESIAITRAIIALANTFGLSITAEGVETLAQLSFLQKEGCHEIQGYYYSKPLILHQLKEFMIKTH